MIIVAGSFKVPHQRIGDLVAAARAMVEATRAEAGCVVYAFALDVKDEHVLRIYEEWESREHLDAHGRQKHMATWRAKLAEIGISERKVTAYEAGAARAL